MELKDFIKETIKQIIEGVEETQKYIIEKKIKATINPKVGFNESTIETVEFDVAVTSTESVENGLSGGIKMAGIISFGGKSNDNSTQQNVNRIKFKVPLILTNQSNDNRKIEKPKVVKRGPNVTL